MEIYSVGLILKNKTIKFNRKPLSIYQADDACFRMIDDEENFIPMTGKYIGEKIRDYSENTEVGVLITERNI